MEKRVKSCKSLTRLNKLTYFTFFTFLTFFAFLTFFTCFISSVVYGAGGDIVWQYGDAKSGKQESKAMAVDSSGNVIITGYQLLSGTDNDFYTVKIKADGSGLAWPAASFNKSGNDDQATAVAVDSSDNIVVTGFVLTAANFDFHTIKYNGSTGAVLWQHTFNGSANGNDEAAAIATDSLNNVYVGGYTQNSSGNEDYLILKYSSDGTLLWQQTYAGTANGQDRITAITAGSDGAAVTGYSWNGTDFDYLTIKYGFDGVKLWDKRYSSTGTNNDKGQYIKMDSSGNVVVTGYVSNGTDMDIYTAKYNGSTSALLWETPHNGGYDDEPKGLWIGSGGNVYVTGYTWTLSGHYDFYTAKYNGSTGALIWPQTFNSGFDNDDIATGIVVDTAGDVFVTGYSSSSGNYDFQTIKYQKDNGNQLWQRSFNGSANNNDRPVGIGLSPTGDVLVAGWSDMWTSGASDYDYYAIKYDPGLLNAPTNLTAEAVSDTQINLAWADNSANEAGFKIERKICELGIYAEIATAESNVTTYNDNNGGSGLTPDTQYCYRVRAYDAANSNSHYSNEANALTTIVSYQPPSWSYIYDGDGSDDYATAIAAGSDNNPVVTGYSFSTAGTFDYYTLKLNRTNGSVLWSARYDDADNDLDVAMCVAVDSSNEVVVSGYSSFYSAAAGMNTNDVYTIKYPATGEPEKWHDSYDGPAHNDDRSTAVAAATDGSNNIVVAGYGKNAALNDDIYVLKYLSNGTRAWAATPYNGAANGNDYPSALVLDASGNIFVTGYTYNGSNYDFFTRKYNADGNIVWTDIFSGGYGNDETNALAVDSSGNLYVTGYITNASGNEDFYTIKYSGATGSRVWERYVDRGGNDRAKSVRIDSIDGSIAIAGTSFTGSGNNDYHIIRYDTDGNVIWQKTLDRPSNDDNVVAMGMDLSGNICVAGDTSAGTTTDIMSVKYDYEGTIIGATIFNGTANNYDYASSIAVNSYGEAFIAGYSINAGGNADYVIYKCSWDPLQVPTPFNITPLYTSIALAWTDNSTAEDGYRIERKIGACTTSDINNTCSSGDAGCPWNWSQVTLPNITSYNDTGLNISETYCYRIKAFKNNGEASRWIGKTVTTLTPGVPDSLAAAVVSTTQINLSWTDNTTGETGFEVWRCEGTNCNPKSPDDGGAGTLIYTTAANAAAYSDTSVCKSTTYGYQVTAFKTGEWETDYSNATGDKTTPTPVAPSLTATRASEVQINLSWNDNNSDETGYKIDRCSDAACASVLTTIPVAANTTAYSDTGLTTATTYYYRIRAYKTATCGWDNAFYSNIANATTTLLAPGSLAATAINTTQINLTWADNTASETGFTIERCTGAGCDFSVKDTFTVGANVIAYSDISVCNSTTYSYQVKAANSTVPWDSGYSNTDAGNTTPTPGVPVLTATRASEVQINLSWNDNNSDETGYKIDRCSDAACASVLTTIPVAANTTAYSDTGLTTATTYYYRVRAYKTTTCGWDNAFYSNIANATTTLLAPGSLTATAANTTQINLTWADNTVSETGFTIERCTGAGCDFSVKDTFTVGANIIAYSDISACNSTTYNYQVKAANDGLSNNGGSCWIRRTPLTISSFQSDYQTRITVTYDTDMQPDFDDVRFYDITSNMELPYWIESKTDGVSATVWVKTGLNNNIYMYYGNASALSASNGSAVFEFFDNFRGSSIDTAKWAEIDPDNSVYQNNDLILNDVSDAWTKALISKQTFTRSADKKIYMRLTIPADTAGNNHFMVGWEANQTTDPSYAQLVHGFYWNNYMLSSYEKGGYTGPDTQSYAASTDYEMNIVLKGIGAKYYVKGGAYANWTLVKETSTYSDSPMRLAFTQYSHQANIHLVSVQKYAATEPGVTAGAEEQSACFTFAGTWASSPGNTAPAATPTPEAPGGLTATAVSESQINLSWTDTNTDETGFKIERKAEACELSALSFIQLVPLNNNFDSGISSDLWNQRGLLYDAAGVISQDMIVPPIDITDGNGVSRITPSGGIVEIYTTSAGGGTANSYNNTRMYLKTPGVIQGDFDVQFDYSLPDGQITAAQYHVYTRFIVYFPNTANGSNYVYVERAVSSAGNYYYGAVRVDGTSNGNSITTTDTSGKLRIKRVGAIISTYAWTGGAWALIKETTGASSSAATNLIIIQYAQRNEAVNLKTNIDNLTLNVSNANATTLSDSNLDSGVTYCYRLKEYKTASCGWETGYTDPPAAATTLAPPAPTNLTATFVSTTQVDLSWTDNTGTETGFVIQRCAGSGCNDFTDLATVGANVTAHSDTSVCNSTSYSYQVRATKSTPPAFDTAYSSPAAATTSAPVAPSGLTATRVSEVQINLSWTDTNTDETGFKIERCTGAGCTDFVEIDTAGAGATTYNNSGLTPDTLYRYQIRAYKTASCSWDTGYSSIAEATTTPSAPGSLTATALNTTQINLAWTDNTATETGFTIERCTGAGCDFSVKDTFTVGANVIAYSDTSVCNSTTYSYRVKAVNSTVPWDSGYSNTDAGNTTPTPGVPVLTATRASEVQINLSWNDNNSDETGYKIDRCSDAACASVLTTIPVAANTTAYSDTGLTTATTYYYRVRAYKTATCGWDNAFYSNIANATTTILAPGSLTATALNTTQINLAWTDNTATETGFTIERCTGAGCDFSVKDTFTVGANVIAYSDTSVCNSTTYSYRVKAVNSTVPWDSGYSNTDAGNTTPTPGVPGALSATAVTDTQVDLSWTDNTTDETGFKIERCAGAGCADFLQIGTTASNISTYSDLTALSSTTYCYRVRAYKTATCSWDTGYSLTACDLSISAHPINLTATALNSMKIRLDWADTSNDEDGFEIEVQVWNGRFVKTATVGPSVSTYTDTIGIEPQKQYIYRVRAYRSSDKSPYSNEASATTPSYISGDKTCE